MKKTKNIYKFFIKKNRTNPNFNTIFVKQLKTHI